MPAGTRLPEGVAEKVADAMFALATPSRVQILHILAAEQRSAGELTEALGMEQSAVSHQLRILREHGLVRAERSGRRRVYSLGDDRVQVLLEAALDHVQDTTAATAGEVAAQPPAAADASG